jgi:hypothetical protein
MEVCKYSANSCLSNYCQNFCQLDYSWEETLPFRKSGGGQVNFEDKLKVYKKITSAEANITDNAGTCKVYRCEAPYRDYTIYYTCSLCSRHRVPTHTLPFLYAREGR